MSALILAALLAVAAPLPAAAQEVHAFNVSAADPASAIRAFGAQAEIQILASADDLKGKKLNAVTGEVSTELGLHDLLAGTGLDHRYVGERAVALVQNTTVPAIAAQASLPASSPKNGPQSNAPAPMLIAQTPDTSSSGTPESNQQAARKSAKSEQRFGELEEIVVTAQRREESLNKVPISVTAFSQKTMDDLHIQNLADLTTVVPGLFVTSTGSTSQDSASVAIRGILSTDNAPTTQFYIDETPIAIRQMNGASFSSSPQPVIFDLDRVEVLRGPQGTLFGASAMGGAIRFITPRPNLNDPSGFVKADVGNTQHGDATYELGAAYGAPLVSGRAGFRVSAWFQSLGGFINQENPFTGEILKNNANSSYSYVVRPAFTWAPTDALTITPALFVQRKHSDNPNSYWLDHLQNSQSSNHVWGGLSQPASDDLRVASLAIKYDWASLSFQSDTSYLDRKYQTLDDFTQLAQLIYAGTPFVSGLESFHSTFEDASSTQAWQQEFRLSSQDPTSRVKWVAGAYYRRTIQGLKQLISPDLTPITEAVFGQTFEQYTGLPNFVYNGQVLTSFTNFHTTDVSEALFGDISADLTTRLKANVGVRIEHQLVEDQHQIVAGPINGLVYSDVVLPDQKGTPITPRVGLTYQYTDTGMVYVSAAKGYRPGGGNSATSVGNSLCTPSLQALGLTNVPSTFQSDSLWSYEVGFKNIAFDRRLSIEASAFYIKWSGIQTRVDLPSCQEVFTTNRGQAISKGVDLQLAAAITDGLKVRGLFGYTDAYYPGAAYGAPVDGVAPLLNGAGDKIARIRPWTFAISADYSRNISSLWSQAKSYVRVDYRRLSSANSRNPSVAGYDPAVEPIPDVGYGTLNVRLGVTRGGLDLSMYVENATNADPLVAYSHLGTAFYGTAITPLTAGVTAWYRF